jgi:rod shape-determining protein MreC
VDSLINRYRNITVLLVVLMAQLLLLAYQVKSDQDVRLIRVWAVSAVTPVARVIESVRSTVVGFFGNYFSLRDIRGEHRKLQEELGKLKLENQHLRAELSTADRARALAVFQSHSQSKTIAARVIGTGAGTGSSVRFIDRGVEAGVQKGMAVITPDGIVGKVTAVYALSSQILLVTDANFGAGVISQKFRLRGTLRGSGFAMVRVEGIPTEAKVETGEWFFTTGDDRVFPKGLPVGQVKSLRPGPQFQEITLDPSGLANGPEEVLVVLEGVHQQIPDLPSAAFSPIYLSPAPPPDASAPPVPAGPGTDADRLRDRYKALGEASGHKYGERGAPPDFNRVEKTVVPAQPPPEANPRPADPARPR